MFIISKLQQDLGKENCKVIELSDRLLKLLIAYYVLLVILRLSCSKELEYTKLEQNIQEQLEKNNNLHNTSLQQAQEKITILQTELEHVSHTSKVDDISIILCN